MQVSKKVQFDLAHRLTYHEGKCWNLHGHTYTVEVVLEGDIVQVKKDPAVGMVMDFKQVKEILNKVIVEPYDHSTMLYEKDELVEMLKPAIALGMNIHVVKYMPTAENMAKFWFGELSAALRSVFIKVHCVRVWETPDSYAEFNESMDFCEKMADVDEVPEEIPLDMQYEQSIEDVAPVIDDEPQVCTQAVEEACENPNCASCSLNKTRVDNRTWPAGTYPFEGGIKEA